MEARTMKIERGDIERQLEEVAPGRKYGLRFNKNLPVRVSIRVTDKAVTVQVNPKRLHSESQLQEVISLAAQEIVRSAPVLATEGGLDVWE